MPATFTPAPAKMTGPRIVRIDHPSLVDYAVGIGAVTDLRSSTSKAIPAGYRESCDRYGEPCIIADYRARGAQPTVTGEPLPAALPIHATITAFDGVDVTVICICALLDFLYGKDRWVGQRDYEAQSAAVMAWCEKHKASYYADDRSTFYIGQGADQARSEGRIVVVVEDLS